MSGSFEKNSGPEILDPDRSSSYYRRTFTEVPVSGQ